MWTDVAGLQDSCEGIIEYVNQLILKKLFVIANSVRFIVAFQPDSLADTKGESLIEILNLIQYVNEHSINNKLFPIQPLLTKC